MGLILALFIFFVVGGLSIGKSIGNIFFPKDRDGGYTDKSIHYHHHHHHHTYNNQNLTVIDDDTHKKALDKHKQKPS